jgi:hypothetical protein
MKLKLIMGMAISAAIATTIAGIGTQTAIAQTTPNNCSRMVISPTDRSTNRSANSAVAANPVASTVAKSGQFVAAEHPTQGRAQIVVENGKRYLQLDQAFATDAGPDLFVLLHRESMPQSYSDTYISLGRLQNIKGEQRYAIPDDVNLDEFQSAVIWCRQFSATFGYAPLSAI